MGNGVSDYMTTKLFLPLTVLLYDWTGIQTSPFLLLLITVVALSAIVLYFMKSI
jgi:hypothetical protein